MAPAKKRKMADQLITDAFKTAKLNYGKIIKKEKQSDATVSKPDVICLDQQKLKEVKSEKTASELDILREFDLNLEYGPCIGISRMERWNRAQKLGLNPPLNVRQLLEFHELDKSYTECVWTAYNI